MKYNLTASQKAALQFIVGEVRAGHVGETFGLHYDHQGGYRVNDEENFPTAGEWTTAVSIPQIDALKKAELLHAEDMIATWSNGLTENYGIRATLTGLAYVAVDEDFKEDNPTSIVSTLAHPHPAEIAMSLDRFRAKYPDPKKVGFLVMRFAAAHPFERIVTTIKTVGAEMGLQLIRADENEFHSDMLWGNVRTHLHGCGFGIAIYERIETEEPNANVGLEVGYMLAMNKPVLLLKDKTVGTLQADLAGKLYKPFDPHDPESTIPLQLKKWLSDYGIVIDKH